MNKELQTIKLYLQHTKKNLTLKHFFGRTFVHNSISIHLHESLYFRLFVSTVRVTAHRKANVLSVAYRRSVLLVSSRPGQQLTLEGLVLAA